MCNTSKRGQSNTTAILSEVTESKEHRTAASSREETSARLEAALEASKARVSHETFDLYNSVILAFPGNEPVQVIIPSNPLQTGVSDDFMFQWSDIFGSSQRSHDDDLCSILSLDKEFRDFMTPTQNFRLMSHHALQEILFESIYDKPG
jgi:hypothetical protein